MAAPAWFPAAAAKNATALSNAARTAASSSPRRVSKQLASSSPVVSSDAGGRASALGFSGRVTSVGSRWLSWAPPERSYQLRELQYSCCSRLVLRQGQQQWLMLPRISKYSPQVPPYYCCPAAGAAGTSPHDTWHSTAPRLCVSRMIASANRELSNTVRQMASAALHVSSKATTNDQQPLQEGPANGADGGRCADTAFAHASPTKKMAAVMQLRKRSGGVSVGECLKALEATNGDTEAAVVHLRKQGLSKAAARRAADYGAALVAVGLTEESPNAASSAAAAAAGGPLPAAAGHRRRMSSVLVALTSETDFVAANARFVALAQQVARAAARTAAAEAATAAGGRTTVVTAEQNGFCSRASVTEAEDISKRKDVATASFLEAVKAATVSESLLTVEAIEVPEVAPAGAAKKATAVSETAGLPSADASLLDTKLAVKRGTGSDGNGTISVSSALALLSQQFGEDVQLSDVKALVVEEQPQQPQQCQGELHTDNSSACSNATVGVYVHGQVAKDVGRAGAMVCLRWRSEITSPHLQTTAAEAQQLETVTRRKMERLAQLLCMQVIATRPRYVKLSDISAAERNVEREILRGAAAAAAAKRRAPASSTTVPAAVVATREEVLCPPAAGAARGGSLTQADAAVEARLEGLLREQTLLEQEFLPLSRFHAEIHTCDGIRNNNSSNSPGGHQSSGTTAGSVSCKNSAASTPSRLTVKEALKRAAVALRCSSIDVESMECLSVGQS